jgi:hypothetical protein
MSIGLRNWAQFPRAGAKFFIGRSDGFRAGLESIQLTQRRLLVNGCPDGGGKGGSRKWAVAAQGPSCVGCFAGHFRGRAPERKHAGASPK